MLSQTEIIGKTYSLYAGKTNTDEYYSVLSELVDSHILPVKSAEEFISIIRKYSGKKRFLKAQKVKSVSESIISKILNELENKLSKYFTDIDSHLKNLSLAEKCDSTLTTSREQYLLYMLEIELVNRIQIKKNLNHQNRNLLFFLTVFTILIKIACLLPTELIMFVRVVQKIVLSTL